MTESLDMSPPLPLSSDSSDLTDRFLLDEFLRPGCDHPQRSEWAFRRLVEWHSPMVLGVCRRVLRDDADAEDAAQAVFLVLWRKATGLTAESLGGWLHRTALLVCQNAIRARKNRRIHEQRAAAMSPTTVTDDADWSAVREVLDAELDRLPEKYRVPLILFHLEDRPHSEIAQLLAVNPATVATWLSRGRELLASRLLRRGITVGAVALATGLSSVASAAPVAPTFAASTVTAASLYGSGHLAVAGGLSASTSALAGECLKGTLLTPLKCAVSGVVGLFVAGAVTLGVALGPGEESPVATQSVPTEVITPAEKPPAEVIAEAPALTDEETDPQFGGITGQVLCTQPFPQRGRDLIPNVPDETLLVDPQTGGVENVFLCLRKAPTPVHPQLIPVPAQSVVVDNVATVFVPHAFFARTGQGIHFMNGSATPINVHTNPVVNPSMNFILKPMDRVGLIVRFAQPETLPVKISDDIHASATSYGLVLDHPYAAITDAAGQFRISHLPVGPHSFRVWHERVGYLERDYQVTVTGGQLVTLPPLSVPSEKLLKR